MEFTHQALEMFQHRGPQKIQLKTGCARGRSKTVAHPMLPPCIENSTRERGATFVKLPEIQPLGGTFLKAVQKEMLDFFNDPFRILKGL